MNDMDFVLQISDQLFDERLHKKYLDRVELTSISIESKSVSAIDGTILNDIVFDYNFETAKLIMFGIDMTYDNKYINSGMDCVISGKIK